VSGLYTADILNTEDITSTFSVTITLYDGYKGTLAGEGIKMVDQQSANKIMHVETPMWCTNLTTGSEYWMHVVVSVKDSAGKPWFENDEWMRIDLAEETTVAP